MFAGMGDEIRKEVKLSKDAIRELSALAKVQRLKLKPYMEKVLIDHAEKSKLKKQ